MLQPKFAVDVVEAPLSVVPDLDRLRAPALEAAGGAMMRALARADCVATM